jgi:replicative superfamily II helicase
MDTAVEAVVSRVRALDVCNNVRLIGLSRSALAYPNDVARILGIPPDSAKSIYNFGHVSDTSMRGVQVVGFTEQQRTTRMQMMSRAVWDTVQAHLQPSKCVCVLVPTRKQVILTAQVLKERVLNFGNPKTWLQSQEKKDKKDICIQDVTVREMLEHGIGLLHPGMCEADCDILQDLASSRKIRVSFCHTVL